VPHRTYFACQNGIHTCYEGEGDWGGGEDGRERNYALVFLVPDLDTLPGTEVA
jgi:hypothetical protein